MDFRQQPKRILTVAVPVEVEGLIRDKTGGRGRRSLAEVTTEVLCIGFGLDPAKYGIKTPDTERRRRKTAV